MKKLFALGVTLLIYFQSHAYPITPRPLRKLVIESEFIIHGKVISIGTEKSGKKNDSWERDVATIAVMEVLQGNLCATTIKVYYTAGMICPAPPVYIEGAEAIIFLDSIPKKKDAFTTHALSYGVKNDLGDEGMLVYKQRIREMQAIENMDNNAKKQEAVLEWLVTCALNKHTRWEGTYELSPGSDFMSYYDREGPTRKDIFLNTAQRNKLFTALINTEKLSYDDVGLIDIAMGINDTILLAKLKKSLALIDNEYLWCADAFMERIVDLTSDDQLEKIYKEFQEKSWFDAKEEALRKDLWKKFVKEMQGVPLKQKIFASSGG